MTSTTDRPEDCRTYQLGDGYTARPSGDLWVIERDGKFVRMAPTAWDAMKAVEALKAESGEILVEDAD